MANTTIVRTEAALAHGPHDRRGAVTVEFALTAGLLFMLLCTSIEFMRVNMIVNSAENIAYEAARSAIVPGVKSAEAKKSARDMLRAIGIRGATINVQPSAINDDTPEVTVTINVPLNRNSFVAPRFFLGDTLTKSCTLSREVNATTGSGAGS